MPLAAACLLSACASYTQVAVGPALAEGDGKAKPAVAVEVARGEGGTQPSNSSFIEARARVLLADGQQQVIGLVGVSRLQWVGDRVPLWGHLGIGPGLEHLSLPQRDAFPVDAVAQGRIGTGIVLSQHSEPHQEWPTIWAQPAAMPPPTKASIVRERTLLTFSAVADVDARFTRAPIYVGSLMLGLAFLVEGPVEDPGGLPWVPAGLLE